ncbi:hypothetical protein V5799_022574 [Amblyomma americanum]|uniref:Acyl-coa synthetase n=1 Tax=Amblyomma americanum TaxID=6943 RepID=A0AAQ4FKH6_AMBAM
MDSKEHPLDTRRNFGEYILQHLRRHANSKWINGTSHEWHNFGEVSEQVEAVRTALCRLGVRQGDKMLLLSANRLQLLPMFLGAACANVACVFESPGFGVDVLAGRMETLGCVAICCEPSWVREALDLQRKLVSVKHVVALDEPAHKGDSAASSVKTWSKLLEEGRASNGLLPPPVEYREDQICYLTSTSGTTGKPKLVVHTHESLLGNVQANSHPRHMPLGAEDVQLSTTSLGHVYALFDGVSKAIVQGASAAFLETANDTAVLDAIQRHRVTAISTTPYTVRGLLENKQRKNYDLSSLRYITTATTYIAQDVAEAVMQELKPKTFTQLYGQSEMPFIAAGLYDAPPKYMSIGPLAMGVEAMVRDVETGKILGPWERGELVVRGPGLMRGYWGKLHESVTDDQGWYSTGDQCYYDDDGWLYLVQRLSDFFICRGSKFWPVEVEAVLLKCPDVRDCAVVGLPHPEAGEVAHAVIVPQRGGGETTTPEHIRRFVEANAPQGCYLEGGVTLVDKIPRTQLGKFARPQLVEWVLEKQKGLR